jgi:DNA-directed RNA polymerase specialized sigma24 family protein
MSLSMRVAAHLPYLRRYSRALLGTQSRGDSCVSATLEALIADVSLFPQTSSDRVSLYKLFSRLNGSMITDPDTSGANEAWEKGAAAHLARIPSLPRQAFLLAAVEGFSKSEIGEILDVPAADVGGLLEEANADIAKLVTTSIMIIEDEPLIAMDLETLVEDLGHYVTGVARTHREAVALFTVTKPSMVLADVHLADGSSGLDAVNDILKICDVPVIFITAFPERLLTGERPEPTFLVTKPYQPDMVKALIGQALFFNEAAS